MLKFSGLPKILKRQALACKGAFRKGSSSFTRRTRWRTDTDQSGNWSCSYARRISLSCDAKLRKLKGLAKLQYTSGTKWWTPEIQSADELSVFLQKNLELDTLLDTYPTTAGHWSLPQHKAKEFKETMFTVGQLHVQLRDLFKAKGIKAFNMTAKSHMLMHIALLSEHVHPTLGWCFQSEGFMRVVQRLLQSCVRGNTAVQAMGKATIHYNLGKLLQYKKAWDCSESLPNYTWLVFFLWALCNWSGKSVDDSKLKQLVRWATHKEQVIVWTVHEEKSNAFTRGLGIQRQIYQNVEGAAENLIPNSCSWEIPINKKYHNVSQKSLLWTLPHRLLSKKKLQTSRGAAHNCLVSDAHMTQPQPRIVCGSPK